MCGLRQDPRRWLAAALLLWSTAGPAAAEDGGADGHWSRRRSANFVLLQDVDITHYTGRDGSRQFEREVLAALEDAQREVRDVLGLEPRKPIQVAIFDPEVFDRTFAGAFRFQAAGFYDGAIRVRGAVRVEQPLLRTLHHEYVHAALHSAAPGFAFPGWVNEGLAEWFEGRAIGKRHLSSGEHGLLAQAAARGQLAALAELGAPTFADFSPEQASLAYLYSYAAIEHLARRHGERRLEGFCEQLVRTRNLARALQRSYGFDLAALESKLRSELR